MDNPWIWLVVFRPTPPKNMRSSIGMRTYPIYGKIKNVPNHQPDDITFPNLWCVFLHRKGSK